MTLIETADAHHGAAGSPPDRSSNLPSVLVVAGAAVGAAAGLWASSLPGSSLLLAVGSLWAWFVAGVGWVMLVGARVLGRSRFLSRPRTWALVAAPLLVVTAVALDAADAPIQARWAVSRDAFDTVAAAARDDVRSGQRVELATPGRLGAYRVAEAYQLGDGVFVVVEGGGGLMSAEGFAHLPSGPDPALESQYEGVTFRSLGDDWFAWSASM